MNESISHKSILYLLIGLLSVRHQNNNYNEEYKRIINEIAKVLNNSKSIVAGKDDKIKIATKDIIGKIADVSCFVQFVITKYLKGEITDASWAFKIQWEKNHIPYYGNKMKKRLFFRMRNKREDESNFVPSDLLHIPLNKRGIIANQRFSINGFPCLYASTSLYQCWEELRRPHLPSLYAAGLLFTNDLRLFDLRLIREINNEKQLETFLVRLPLIIACSIKTIDDEALFKAEYIIPQILLHHLITKKHNLDGIIYSSMRKDYDYYKAYNNPEECSRNENIVIPAKITYEGNDFVDNLTEMIEISEPLNFEQEIIKGSIAIKSSALYSNTLFGQMEELILSAKVYKASNINAIPLQTTAQLYNKLNNSINIL